ncbi:MAG TPA: phosphoenolpyruvate--protein phosphotransferase [Pyrinomonadaceae bacterium]|nr:phosphoenolpyruvate--protein phosphotransferase [Pyrinomonadaceae bacterium]
MKGRESSGNETSQKPKAELRLKAHAVSRGIAIGRVVCLHGRNRQFYRIDIGEHQIQREIRRLRAAVRLSSRQLKHLSHSSNGQPGKSSSGIFDAHRMILEDASFQQKIEGRIADDLVNAEWAVKLVGDSYIAKYKAIPDEGLRERYIDLEDVIDRIQNALGGGSSHIKIGKDTVIAAQELKPSTLAELSDRFPNGLITEHGGWTSHTFILAREINVPAVTGLKKVLRRLKTGDRVIVDGFHGEIIVHPQPETLRKFRQTADRLETPARSPELDTSAVPRTLDGREIVVRANLDIPTIYKKAKKLGARGIGLYRSEFLFNQFKGFPGENEQAAAYSEIAEFAGEDGVKVRTFDLNAEQLYGEAAVREKNPALGLRAVRLSLGHEKEFRTQLRAILRASYKNNIDVVVPMISGVAEIREVRKLLGRENEYLSRKGIPAGTPRLGSMIEVPSAVFLINEIVDESDLICLGTNDLVQYLLAADRDNESVADWFRTLHPAVIRAISEVATASIAAQKPLIVCGEMAGSPFYLPLLIGLGVNELSMNMNSISRIRRMISGVAYEECVLLGKAVLQCRTADEIEKCVFDHIAANWSHLFPADFVENRRL